MIFKLAIYVFFISNYDCVSIILGFLLKLGATFGKVKILRCDVNIQSGKITKS